MPERYAHAAGAGSRGGSLNGAARDPRTGRFVVGAADDDGLVEVTVRVTPEEAEWYFSEEYEQLLGSPEHRAWCTLWPHERELAIVEQIRERIEAIEARKAGEAEAGG